MKDDCLFCTFPDCVICPIYKEELSEWLELLIQRFSEVIYKYIQSSL